MTKKAVTKHNYNLTLTDNLMVFKQVVTHVLRPS